MTSSDWIVSWKYYRDKYEYPVNVSKYEYADKYYTYFEKDILGDRKSTIEFEDYFRKNAEKTSRCTMKYSFESIIPNQC